MSRAKNIAMIILVVGILVLLASVLADVIGVGGSPRVFGYRQMMGAAVGCILAIAGAVLYWWSGRHG
jgi:hypothetical protein